MSTAPVTPRITKVTKVSIPRKPKGLRNFFGSVSLIPRNIVLSSMSMIQTISFTIKFELDFDFSAISNYPVPISGICWRINNNKAF